MLCLHVTAPVRALIWLRFWFGLVREASERKERGVPFVFHYHCRAGLDDLARVIEATICNHLHDHFVSRASHHISQRPARLSLATNYG